MKGDVKYLFSVLAKHVSVRIEGNTIYMLPTTEGFQFVFHNLLTAIMNKIEHRGGKFPAYHYFPKMEWELELPDIKDIKKYF